MPMPMVMRLSLLVVLFLAYSGVMAQDDLDSTYELGPGDVISIQVFGESNLSFDSIRLTDAATVPYPFLGEIRALGRTRIELEQAIAAGLQDGYLVNPQVTVHITRYRDFYVSGEVRSPGSYTFEPGMTVRRAIAKAGGLTDRASTGKMYLADPETPSDEDGRSVEMDNRILPGEILTIGESFF